MHHGLIPNLTHMPWQVAAILLSIFHITRSNHSSTPLFYMLLQKPTIWTQNIFPNPWHMQLLFHDWVQTVSSNQIHLSSSWHKQATLWFLLLYLMTLLWKRNVLIQISYTENMHTIFFKHCTGNCRKLQNNWL